MGVNAATLPVLDSTQPIQDSTVAARRGRLPAPAPSPPPNGKCTRRSSGSASRLTRVIAASPGRPRAAGRAAPTAAATRSYSPSAFTPNNVANTLPTSCAPPAPPSGHGSTYRESRAPTSSAPRAFAVERSDLGCCQGTVVEPNVVQGSTESIATERVSSDDEVIPGVLWVGAVRS